MIIGNRNSNIYHLPQSCPSYDKVSPKNQVLFTSEAEASAAGYRKQAIVGKALCQVARLFRASSRWLSAPYLHRTFHS